MLQFYIFLIVFYKIISFIFHMHSSVCPLLFTCKSFLSESLWRSKAQNSGSACFRTSYISHTWWLWPDLKREGNKRVGYTQDLQKTLTNPCFRKPSCNSGPFMLCYRKIFVPKNCDIKTQPHFSDDQGTFSLVFVFTFTSCYNSNVLYYRNLECGSTTIWMLNPARNFKVGIASRETII